MSNLSIIIPHYNSPVKLKRLLKSIPSTEGIEVIVVDDRSNKDLAIYNRIKKDYQDKDWLFLENYSVNKGAGACRNIGLKQAKGRWVLFADADDYFTDSFHHKISTYFNSDLHVVFFCSTSWDDFKDHVSDRHKQYNDLIHRYNPDFEESVLSLKYRFMVPWSKLIKRDFITQNAIHFDEVIASNDNMFSIKVAYHIEKYVVSREVIYCVTKDSGTLTQNISREVFRTRLSVFIDRVIFLREHLNKKQFKYLNHNGTAFLLNVIKFRLGIKEFMRTVRLLRVGRVKLIDSRFYNPWFTIKKFHVYYQYQKTDKDYKTK